MGLHSGKVGDGQHKGELIPPDATEDIAAAQLGLPTQGQALQHTVTELVPLAGRWSV